MAKVKHSRDWAVVDAGFLIAETAKSLQLDGTDPEGNDRELLAVMAEASCPSDQLRG